MLLSLWRIFKSIRIISWLFIFWSDCLLRTEFCFFRSVRCSPELTRMETASSHQRSGRVFSTAQEYRPHGNNQNGSILLVQILQDTVFWLVGIMMLLHQLSYAIILYFMITTRDIFYKVLQNIVVSRLEWENTYFIKYFYFNVFRHYIIHHLNWIILTKSDHRWYTNHINIIQPPSTLWKIPKVGLNCLEQNHRKWENWAIVILSRDEVEEFFKRMDRDFDGRLSFEEFMGEL